MKMFKGFFVIFIISCALVKNAKSEATKEDMAKAANLMKQACLPRFKIPEAMLADTQKKILAEDRELMCYINCMLEMMQIMKKGKLNYQAALKQVDALIPSDVKDDYRKGIEACKDSANSVKDHCESSFNVMKCFIANNPNFEIP